MPLVAPITVWEQATQLKDWLGAWVYNYGGQCDVVANMRHLWEEALKALDGKPRILICWNGETARGGFREANTLHRVDRQWVVVALRGHGWKRLMHEGEGDEVPFYEVVEALRDNIRRVTSISEEFPVDFKAVRATPGVATPQQANVFIDGYAVEFSTANDISAATATDEGL